MTLSWLGLIFFLLAPIFVGAALAWVRIRDEQAAASLRGSRQGPQPARESEHQVLPPAA